ncbi:MAG TPA: methionine gamma-lyase family protein [Clostridia bacterium]|nr:MAG: cystathionine gamma-synthase [Firmicutes bacterium ADurb.Bin146]HOD92374.1 methionine gamma-lyase family protein [Clostridia bacterium]HQM38629.1 methionine gamma-lyase family protein [Clostridia bacterium]
MIKEFDIDKRLIQLADSVQKECDTQFEKLYDVSETNQVRITKSFQEKRVSDAYFAETTGYGYSDRGRELLDEVYADIFCTEDALVRESIASGTAAISLAMAANLRPGDEIIFANGMPYDTLRSTVGITKAKGSLAEYNITHKIIDTKDGKIDEDTVEASLSCKTKMVFVQRSRGYSLKPPVSKEQFISLSKKVKAYNKDIILFADNCYGEFVQDEEPTQWGMDMAAGSLIKNPGGGLCRSGGYIVGTKECIDNASARLYAPGLLKEVGATNNKRLMFQGLYMAPHTVMESLKGAVFTALLFEKLGFKSYPKYNEERKDIIQLVMFDKSEQLLQFCRGVQAGSPIDSHVTPYPWDMPGYDDKVVMAAGTFVQGASIEFSADAPLREPYIAYMQGGLTYTQVKLGVLKACDMMIKKGMLHI